MKNLFSKSIQVFTFLLIITAITSCKIAGTTEEERPILHGLWKSKDKGFSWQYSTGTVEQFHKTGIFPPINIYEFVRDPYVPGIIYTFTNLGLWRTIDEGISWKSMNRGLRDINEIKQVNFLFFNPHNTNDMVVTGFGDVFISHDGAENWVKHDIELDKNVTVVGAFLDPQKTSDVFAIASDGSKKYSVDGGNTWRIGKWFSDEISIGRITKFLMNPYNINELFVITVDGNIWRSLDRGETWARKSIILNPTVEKSNQVIAIITSIDFDYFNTPNRILAGTPAGVYSSTNGGESWDLFTKNLPIRQPNIYALDVDQRMPQRMCFTTSRVVIYCTENNGASWNSSEIQLSPDMPGAILLDSLNPSLLYLGMIRVN